jgi:hypothetical protein
MATRSKAVTLADLRAVEEARDPSVPRPHLYCGKCGEQNSAYPGDYFMCSPSTVFKHCGRLMSLVRTRMIQEPVAIPGR